jgi:hypothetical protein
MIRSLVHSIEAEVREIVAARMATDAGAIRDGGVVRPMTGAEAAEAIGFSLTAWYNCQEGRATIYDRQGSADLAVVSTPHFGEYFDGVRGVATTASAAGWAADVLDLAADSAYFVCEFVCPVSSASTRSLFGRNAVSSGLTAPYFNARVLGTSDTVYVYHNSGAGDIFLDLSGHGSVADAVPRLLQVKVDRTGDITYGRLSKLTTKVGTAAQVSTAALGSLAGGASPRFMLGSIIGSLATGGIQIRRLGALLGADAEAVSMADVARRLRFE